MELQASIEHETFDEKNTWSFFKPKKTVVTLRLDADVVAWFKKQGKGYQTRINRSLRERMLSERKSRGIEEVWI